MNKISLNKVKFQSFIDWIVFVFRLLSGTLPPVEIKRASFVMPVNRERAALKKAVDAFNLKKTGGAR